MRGRRESGSISVLMLMLLALVVAITAALVHLMGLVQRSAGREQASAQALCLAESGAQVALHRLAAGEGYRGETDTPLGQGSYSVSVRGHSPVDVVSTGRVTVAGRLELRRSVRVRATLAGGRFRVDEWEEIP